MADGCKFEDCKYLANESGYCPRHDLLIQTEGLEPLMDRLLGKACSVCGQRDLEVELEDCGECDAIDVCPDCINAQACCIGIFDEDDDDDFDDEDD